MRMRYTYPLTFVGGAAGWQAVKAVIFPVLFLTGAVAGSTEYVQWVIKSHNANVLHLKAGADGVFIGELRVSRFIEDLKEMVEVRDDFIVNYKADDHSGIYIAAKIAAMRLEDEKVLAEADQLRSRSSEAYTAEIATKTERLKVLDEKLKTIGDEAAGRRRS